MIKYARSYEHTLKYSILFQWILKNVQCLIIDTYYIGQNLLEV